jgi:hypothetical protein
MVTFSFSKSFCSHIASHVHISISLPSILFIRVLATHVSPVSLRRYYDTTEQRLINRSTDTLVYYRSTRRSLILSFLSFQDKHHTGWTSGFTRNKHRAFLCTLVSLCPLDHLMAVSTIL